MQQQELIFQVIRKCTKFCASCGKPFDMAKSRHSHLPFCEGCRAELIKREMGTTERKESGGNQNG